MILVGAKSVLIAICVHAVEHIAIFVPISAESMLLAIQVTALISASSRPKVKGIRPLVFQTIQGPDIKAFLDVNDIDCCLNQ